MHDWNLISAGKMKGMEHSAGREGTVGVVLYTAGNDMVGVVSLKGFGVFQKWARSKLRIYFFLKTKSIKPFGLWCFDKTNINTFDCMYK